MSVGSAPVADSDSIRSIVDLVLPPIDLVVDVNGNTNDRKVILGSATGGSCPMSPPGADLVIKAHGTAYVP